MGLVKNEVQTNQVRLMTLGTLITAANSILGHLFSAADRREVLISSTPS
jgi:hypothetical protein